MQIKPAWSLILMLLLMGGCTRISDKQVDSNGMQIKYFENRSDSALRITKCYPMSCQNPVFSPDGKYVMFTKFLNGYNKGPSELVKIDIVTGNKQVVVKTGTDNVNVPYGSWIGNRITWACETSTGDEICVANDDGTDINAITKHDRSEGYYIEPVFDPLNNNKIAFEYAPAVGPHSIELVELNKESRITSLTNDTDYDDRLPSWSNDGKKILWQRKSLNKDDWEIYVADIILEPSPHLENVRSVSPGPDDTDNSWEYDNWHILSSSTGDGVVPNIFAFSLDGRRIRITTSDREDGAPSQSPDQKLIVFESHAGDEGTPSDIWVIQTPGIK